MTAGCDISKQQIHVINMLLCNYLKLLKYRNCLLGFASYILSYKIHGRIFVYMGHRILLWLHDKVHYLWGGDGVQEFGYNLLVYLVSSMPRDEYEVPSHPST